MDKTKKPDRRNFLIGMVTGAGVAAVAMGIMGRAGKNVQGTDSQEASVESDLYRRTAEAERYYKTLYI